MSEQDGTQPSKKRAGAAKQTPPINRMASKLLLHNVPTMMIKRDGKPTGKQKVNLGVPNLRLTLSVKHTLLSDGASSLP
jgi:hypothetical protein